MPMPDEGETRCAPARGEFRWLHLNLADEWTRSWIESAAALPEPHKAMLLSPERHQHSLVDGEFVGCVIHDVERDFDRLDAERTGVLRIVLGPRLIITARQHPVHSADIVRKRIEEGRSNVRGAADAIDLVVSAIIENIAAVSREQAAEIEAFEDVLLDRPERFDNQRLIGIRRRVVQFHRLLSGMSAVFRRLEEDEELPRALLPTIGQLAQRLAAIDSDMGSVQSQLRLLREEADLQEAKRTNRSLYVLSVLSALLLPATLVTGFFGMNTGGLPFATGASGTLSATLCAVLASLAVYAALRAMGLISRE